MFTHTLKKNRRIFLIFKKARNLHPACKILQMCSLTVSLCYPQERPIRMTLCKSVPSTQLCMLKFRTDAHLLVDGSNNRYHPRQQFVFDSNWISSQFRETPVWQMWGGSPPSWGAEWSHIPSPAKPYRAYSNTISPVGGGGNAQCRHTNTDE